MVCKESMILAVTVLLVISNIGAGYKVPTGEECPPDKELCEFYIVIEERLVVKHEDTVEVPYQKGGQRNGRCKMGRFNMGSNTCTLEEQNEVNAKFVFNHFSFFLF